MVTPRLLGLVMICGERLDYVSVESDTGFPEVASPVVLLHTTVEMVSPRLLVLVMICRERLDYCILVP